MTKCPNRVGLFRWEVVQMEGVTTIIPTQLSEGVTEFSQLIFMFQGARQRLKLFCMEFYSYRKKFIKIRIRFSGILSRIRQESLF